MRISGISDQEKGSEVCLVLLFKHFVLICRFCQDTNTLSLLLSQCGLIASGARSGSKDITLA